MKIRILLEQRLKLIIVSKSVLGSAYKREDFAKKMVELVNQRKKHFGTWKLSQLRNLSFEEVKEEFDKLTSKRLKSDEAKDDESTKKTGTRRKQIARKGLHSDKTGEDESEASKDADPISGVNIPGSDENSLKLYDLIADMKGC
ncbi:hypothetical protein Tco_1069212 [Tanacetum coccineum]|uniref:Uncharacterized protein n=1 Tax=Tanacetum coccineum TaxID=301880 RepID=A0ABQ5HJS1_9ASTR